MSKPKSSKRRAKSNSSKRKKQTPTTSAAPPSNIEPEPTEKVSNHLKFSTILLVVVPFIAVISYFAWSALNPESEAEKISNAKPASAANGKGTRKKKSDAATPATRDVAPTSGNESWNRPCLAENAWASEDDLAETWSLMDDPSRDGWNTEVLSRQVGEQLNHLKKLLTSDKPLEAKTVQSMVAKDVSVHPLRPENLKTIFEGDSLQIRRANLEASANASQTQPATVGPEYFANQLKAMLEAYTDREAMRLKIKVLKIEKNDSEIATHQTVEIFGATESGLKETNALWIARWQADGDSMRLKEIRVAEYETVDRADKKTLFLDCTESALGGTDSFRKQLLQGYDRWLERSQFNRFYSILGNPGIAICDVNSDGLEDMYVCQEGGLPNLLYLQNPDGTLRDASSESGADWLQSSSTALILDLDNDGHNDLAVGVLGGVVVARGNGNGQFEVQTVLECSDHVLALAAADYDRDGLVDIYAGAYMPRDLDRDSEEFGAPGLAANGIAYSNFDRAGAANSLFRNESAGAAWNFRDVTEASGLSVNNQRLTLAASWEDFDNDGDQDLYVANDFGLNNLYRNDTEPGGQGTFVDISNDTQAEDNAFGMAITWADYDRDGWIDLYVSNMFSYAGHRITYQDQFQAKATDSVKKGFSDSRVAIRYSAIWANPMIRK